MISNDYFNFIYKNDDENISINKGLKRNCQSVRATINDVKRRKLTEDKREDEFKKLEFLKNNPIPDIIIKQSCFEKINFSSVRQIFMGLSCIWPNSNKMYKVTDQNLNFHNDHQMPILLFLFDYSNLTYLKFFEIFKSKNIRIIGITPEFNYFNHESFPIILDNAGKIAKLLKMRNPLGGGVFPIPSIFLFDRFQKEIIRIKLGYDYNIFYDSTLKNNLQKVLIDSIDYTLNI
jgi:hypothetical protein